MFIHTSYEFMPREGVKVTYKKKGGLITAVQQHAFWLIILTGITIIMMLKLVSVKKNYTDLHRRVHELEYKVYSN